MVGGLDHSAATPSACMRKPYRFPPKPIIVRDVAEWHHWAATPPITTGTAALHEMDHLTAVRVVVYQSRSMMPERISILVV